MPTINCIYPIVEGHGELEAVPILIRRIAAHFEKYDVRVMPAYRLPRSAMLHRSDKFGAAIRLCEARLLETGTTGGVLLCVDADDDEPGELRQLLQMKIDNLAPRVAVLQMIPVREFEAWFLASAQAYRAHARCRDDAAFGGDAETIRNAKGLFQECVLKEGEYYSETVDQGRFTALMDFRSAKRCGAFQQFFYDIRHWFAAE